MKKKAVIVLSGGLDSATCLAIAKEQGFECYAISFLYRQRSEIEIEAAKKVCNAIGVKQHQIFTMDIGQFGHSALTDTTIDIPEDSDDEIPITYVPARNTVFLSIALGWAEVLGAFDIFYGANIVDYSGYPDCRPDYVAAFETMANLATRAANTERKFRVCTPLMHLDKAEIIRKGVALGVDFGLTCSCYDANEQNEACGCCESCQLRADGFKEAGVVDPTRYIMWKTKK